MDYAFDIECLPNIFTCVFQTERDEWIFEVSERRNESLQFITFIHRLAAGGHRMVGFNNIGYDYPVIHHLVTGYHNGFYASDAHWKSREIITTPWDQRFFNHIRPSERIVPQIDLYKIHHFDNAARSTSLKQIEITLRMGSVVEFAYPMDQPLPSHLIPELLAYNRYDVTATRRFYEASKREITFREDMSRRLGEDVLNQSDTNIGSKIFIKQLNAHTPGICGRSGQWRQTPRARIALAECIFPYVSFTNKGFRSIHQRLMATTITETKGVFDDLQTDFAGMPFVFGTGGLHAAKDGHTWRAGNGRIIGALDVKSYYPNLAIKNRVFPEHLSEIFCDIYQAIYDERAQTAKSDPVNAALKLALNGTYGNSNSRYSPFYDPKYTMTITINGQLLLCMLCEWLATVPTLELIQANTDGVMYAIDETYTPYVAAIAAQWQQLTGLELESDTFDIFAQRDVNNYVARDTSGKVKSKGIFEYQHGLDEPGGNWHKNQSNKIIPIAAERFIMTGTPVADTVNACDNPFYFMSTLKVQRNDRVRLGGELVDYTDVHTPPDKNGRHPLRKKHIGGEAQQRIGRYYMARQGEQLWKIMSPLRKLPHHERPQAIEKGCMVAMCNDLYDFDWNNLDRSYYVHKAEELIDHVGFHR